MVFSRLNLGGFLEILVLIENMLGLAGIVYTCVGLQLSQSGLQARIYVAS